MKEAGRLEREDSAYVDSDELDGLIAGVQYIRKATKDITKMDQWEAEYATKGKLRITAFGSAAGGVQAAVTVGQITPVRAFIKAEDLERLERYFVGGKDFLVKVAQ